MTEKKKNIFFTIAVTGVVFFLSGLLFFGKKEEYSNSERRLLQKFPVLTKETFANGKFTKELEDYSLDHFPFRDGFRSLKTAASAYLFQTKDQNGLYKKEGYLMKREYPLNEPMIQYAGEKFQEIYETYLKDTKSRCYYSIVPDKNYFTNDKYQMLSMDYDKLVSLMKDGMKEMEYLDIFPILSLEDYYFTDTHWKQEELLETASFLMERMGHKTEASYEVKEIDTPFYGVYAGQWGLPVKSDKLRYLTNKTLENCRVEVIEGKKKEEIPVYDMEKVRGKDPYEMFLSGARAIQIMENPEAKGKGELILFRDSFGSSIAPLFAECYEKIILVDLRYVQSKFLNQYINFHGQDVLFLYSTTVLNQSLSLK